MIGISAGRWAAQGSEQAIGVLGIPIGTAGRLDSAHGKDERMEEDGGVEGEAAMGQVVEVVFNVMVDEVFAVGAQLPETCDSGSDFKASGLQRSVAIDDEAHFGPRPYQRHFAAKNVEQLGQLVETGLAEDATNGSDARVGF